MEEKERSVMLDTSRYTRAVSIAAVCLAISAPAMLVADDEVQRNSLKGILGLRVLVEHLPADIEQHGLTTDAIKTDVELRLRRSGIQVFSAYPDDPSPAKAVVYVNVAIKQESGTLKGLYAASITVELQQWLRSQVSGLETPGATWERGSVLTIGQNNLRQLRDSVNDKVDELINDYLAANPKRP
jgi:hypothetical protein